MNVLVVNPYKAKILRTVEALEKVNIGEVRVLGDYSKIAPILEAERIKLKCSITNITDDEALVEAALMHTTNETVVLFGDIMEHYQKKILGVIPEDDINYFYVADLLELRHFVFVSNYSKKRHLDFEDKRKAISSIFSFMKVLGVKKSNVALVTDKAVKSDILEVNLIRMILKDEMAKNVNILSPCRLSEVFDHKSECNIYNKNVNMLIFKNYDITKTFIDTMSILRNFRIASICNIREKMFINGSELKDEQDILFSVLLVSKYLTSVQDVKIKYQIVGI